MSGVLKKLQDDFGTKSSQIREKEYGMKYSDSKLYLVGIEIDDEIRNVSRYRIESTKVV